jgi:hypothetical protein
MAGENIFSGHPRFQGWTTGSDRFGPSPLTIMYRLQFRLNTFKILRLKTKALQQMRLQTPGKEGR